MTTKILKAFTFLLVSCHSLMTATATDKVEGCLYSNTLWGSMDGTKFYFCLPDTDTNTIEPSNSSAIEQPCPQNTFFVKNSTVSGCLPLDRVQTECVYRSAEPPPCTGINLKQPQPSINPTEYYLCAEEGARPVQMSCPAGKAFVNQGGYLGCFPWPQWRQIRNCPLSEFDY